MNLPYPSESGASLRAIPTSCPENIRQARRAPVRCPTLHAGLPASSAVPVHPSSFDFHRLCGIVPPHLAQESFIVTSMR
jgi:hypothetical protein